MEAFMGMIMPVGFNYAPRGWAFCNGQTVPIQQNSAMFALLGTTYGGDGVNTFGLPDLRGRVPVGSQAAGPGLTPIAQGEKAGTNTNTVIGTGSATVTLNASNLPPHTHPATFDSAGLTGTTHLQASTGTTGTSTTPANGSFLSASPSGPSSASIYSPTATGPVNLGGVSTAIGGTGAVTVGANTGGQPLAAPVTTTAMVSNMQPYLGLNYIICMEGIFPSRN
jgi:microcystin-dependent protein